MSHKKEIENAINFIKKNYFVNSNGKIKSVKNNRYFTLPQVFAQYSDLQDTIGNRTELELSDFEELLKDIKGEAEEAPRIDLYSYLKNDLFNHPNFRIDTTFSEIQFKANGKNYYSNSNFDELLNDYRSRAETDQILMQYRIGTIEATIKKIATECNNISQNLIADKISFEEKYVQYTDKFLRAFYDYFKIKEDFEIFKMLMMHWMWQVKRKITNREVVWHIWLNILGPTGTGKTYFVRKLCNVFDNYYIESQMRVIFDDTREIGKFTSKYIINFDELAVNKEKFVGGEATLTKDEIATLKSFVTGEKKDTRIYGTQRQATNTLTTSIISTANEHLYDVFYDDTSMRRYFEFTSERKKQGTEEEKKTLNDFLDHSVYLWKAVDENREQGYWDQKSETSKKITEIQQSYYPTKSTILYFNKFYEFKKDMSSKSSETYNTYSTWCKNSGFKAKSLLNFNQEIAKRWPNLIGQDHLPHFSVKLRDDDISEIVESYTAKPEVEIK